MRVCDKISIVEPCPIEGRIYLLPIATLRQQREGNGAFRGRIVRFRVIGPGIVHDRDVAVFASHGQGNIKCCFALELSRLEAFGHHLRIFALKFCLIFWIDGFFWSRDDNLLVVGIDAGSTTVTTRIDLHTSVRDSRWHT